jgi:hypothetical protein
MVVATDVIEEISVGGKCMEWIHCSYGGRRCAFPPYCAGASGVMGCISFVASTGEI